MNKIKGKQIESVDLDQVLMESDLVVTSAPSRNCSRKSSPRTTTPP